MGSIFDELRAALHAVWTRRWIALAVAWGVCLAGWLVVSQIPNRYESTARVFVQLRSIIPGQGASVAQIERGKDIERVRQTLTSAVNMEKVVRGTDLANTVSSPADIAARIAGLQKAVKITAQQDNLFEITATLADTGMSDAMNAKLSRAIVQKMIDIFVEDNLANNRDQTSQSLKFLDDQIALRQRQLQDKENRKAEFAAEFLVGLPGTGSLGDRMTQARSELANTESELAGANSSLSAVNAQMGGTSATVADGGGTAVAGPARARLSAIEGQIAEGRARGWTDSHPDMMALNAQLSQARSAASSEGVRYSGGGGNASNPLYLTLKAQQADRAARVAELNQKKSLLQAQLGQLQEKLAADPNAAAQQSQIDRDIDSLRQSYSSLSDDREQVRLQAQASDQTDAVKFSVIDPPILPRSPASPNRPLLLTAVLIAGLGAGVGAAFALSKLKTTFATSGQLEKASRMPVIGSIGEVVSSAQTSLRMRQLKLFAGGAGALGVAYIMLIGVEFVQRGLMA